MVTVWLALLAASGGAATSSAAEGAAAGPWIVGRVHGSMLAWTGTAAASAPGVPGMMLRGASSIEVGGWCELWTATDARVRLGGGARVRLGAGAVADAQLEVERGRAWIQLASSRGATPATVRVGRWLVLVPPGASAVVERSPSVGSTVAVRAGEVVVTADDGARAPVTVTRGQVARGAAPRVLPGGEALVDLVASQARDAQRDPLGMRAYLVERSRRSVVGRLDTRGVSDVLRVDAELAGADGGPLGMTLEEALRPPPFFEREVPTKGPNVEIVVEFAE